MRIVKEIRPDISVDEVCRLLGYKKGRDISGRLVKKVTRSVKTAYTLIRPRVVYTEKKIERTDGRSLVLSDNVVLNSGKLSGTLKTCDRAGLFIATIGKSVDSHIQKLANEGKMAEACIFDAIGSVAAENTVDKFQQMCDQVFTGCDEKTTLRFSPGYCDWTVQEQKKLFEVMDNCAIDVHLSPTCLMTPRKSVSGVFGIAQEKDIARTPSNPCMRCGMHRCAVRRTGE